jgi:hypothetical protein
MGSSPTLFKCLLGLSLLPLSLPSHAQTEKQRRARIKRLVLRSLSQPDCVLRTEPNQPDSARETYRNVGIWPFRPELNDIRQYFVCLRSVDAPVRVVSFPHCDCTVQSIMPVCRYAICPVPNCMGLVIPAYEPASRKAFLELTRNWYLECPACQQSFVIPDSELKTDEISFARIRQTYPDKP